MDTNKLQGEAVCPFKINTNKCQIDFNILIYKSYDWQKGKILSYVNTRKRPELK